MGGTIFIIMMIAAGLFGFWMQKKEKEWANDPYRHYGGNTYKVVKDFDARYPYLIDKYFPEGGTDIFGNPCRKNKDDVNVCNKFWAEMRELIKQLEERHGASLPTMHYVHLQMEYPDKHMRIALQRLEEHKRQELLRKQQEQAAEEERKRKEELRQVKEKAALYKYINIGGYKAAYRFDYYPKNRYPYIDSTSESNRKSIWNFKNGDHHIGEWYLKEFLKANFDSNELKGMTLCVIPASSKEKHITRYKQFCINVANELSMTNGFGYISILYDRDDSREHKSANTIGNLSFSNEIYGKHIILFDDITTRGTSFIQIANKLKEKGALSVYGFFLGKTV